MAYVKHKPQYRIPATPGGRSTGRPRDIRRSLPDARGKVILPDQSGLPRRASFGSPALSKRPAFGKAGFIFSPPAMKGRPPSVWWRGGAAQLAPAMRGAMWFMAAYDLYKSVDSMLGGDSYFVGNEEPWAGGPNGNYNVVSNPRDPTQWMVVPTPDGTTGWEFYSDPAWREVGLTGAFYPVYPYVKNHGRHFPTPWNNLHRPMPNWYGDYSPQEVIDQGVPPELAIGRYAFESRVQNGGNIDNAPVWGVVRSAKAFWTKPLPTPAPVNDWPGIIIAPGPSAPTPAEIADLWPTVGAQVPALLPFGQPWVPLPWSAVNAVNQVRGAIGIREENFLDDVGNPRPAPKPQVNHKPPGRGEKEKKGRSNNGNLLLFYNAVKKAWHEIDEHVEKVDILYDALPGWVRNRERAKLPHEKIAALLRNWQHIDVGEAVYGLIENEVEDAAFGRGFKSLEEAFEKMGVRGWRGDLAMSYSTDALFELYGALKGGL